MKKIAVLLMVVFVAFSCKKKEQCSQLENRIMNRQVSINGYLSGPQNIETTAKLKRLERDQREDIKSMEQLKCK